jgi:SAM-dependent methyltransferase
MKPDNFVHVPFTKQNLDRYIVRTAILEALKANVVRLNGKLLDAGCGKMPYRTFIMSNSKVTEYVGLDIEGAIKYDAKVKPDFTWDGVTMPFSSGEFDCAFATEVLEHCPDPEIFLREVNRVLKPGGIFFFTVPFLWNLHEVPHDEYRYTPFSLHRHLTNASFTAIELLPTGGWHASMGQMLGLWVRRAPMPRALRAVLSVIAKPVIGLLNRNDKKYPVNFKEGVMITGMYGTAMKPASLP